jgi:NTP pyrophosphatase (non-canonical NTP hydrolase)
MEGKRFNSLNELQSIQGWWEKQVVPEEDRTPQTRFTRMIDEVIELGDAIDKNDGTPEKAIEAGLECADVFIILMGVIDSLGLDIQRLVDMKLETNHFKYNVEENSKLRTSGLSWRQALQVQKERYKK